MGTIQTTNTYRIDKWLIYPLKNEFVRDQEVIRVETKAMQVLDYLAKRAGEIVSREELMEHVWSDVFVSEDTLSRCISILRKAFEDSPTKPKIIQTIKGEGYRIIVPVEFYGAEASSKKEFSFELLNSKPFVYTSLLAFPVLFFISYFVFNQQSNEAERHWEKIPIATSKIDERYPVISPDGSRIAYSAYNGTETQLDIFVKIANGSDKAIQITHSPGNETCPVWSTDGQYIAYYTPDEVEPAIFVISSLGGSPKKIGEPFDSMPQQMAWSNDGKHIAYADRESAKDSYSIYILEVETGKKSKLTRPTSQHWGDYGPSFSPDDRKLSFIRAISAGTHDIYIYDFKTQKSKRLTFHTRRTSGQVWSADGKSIIYAHEDGNTGVIWRVPSNGGKSKRLYVSGLRPSIDRSGKNLVVEEWNYDYDIFSIDLSSLSPQKKEITQVNSTYEDFDPIESPSASYLAFISNRSGSYELWLHDRIKDEIYKVTHFANSTYLKSPSWSHNGNSIAFTVFTSEGNADIYVLDLLSNSIKKLLKSSFNEISPAYSMDDQSIYFGSNRTGIWQVWKLHLASKTLSQVTQNGGYGLLIPKGDSTLYFSKFDTKGIWRHTQDPPKETLLTNDLHLFDWSNYAIDSNKGTYYISRKSAVSSTYLNYLKPDHTIDTVMNAGFSRNTRIRLSANEGLLYGAQVVDKDVDVVLYKL